MKKLLRRRRQRRGQSQQKSSPLKSSGRIQAVAKLPAKPDETMMALGNAFVVGAARTRHGPRKWGRLEYVQAAIASLYPKGPPKFVNESQLKRDVNAKLKQDPAYQDSRYGDISRMTVRRALETFRNKNR